MGIYEKQTVTLTDFLNRQSDKRAHEISFYNFFFHEKGEYAKNRKIVHKLFTCRT